MKMSLCGGRGSPPPWSLEGFREEGFQLLVISSLHTKLSIQLLLASGRGKAEAFALPAGSNFALVTFR